MGRVKHLEDMHPYFQTVMRDNNFGKLKEAQIGTGLTANTLSDLSSPGYQSQMVSFFKRLSEELEIPLEDLVDASLKVLEDVESTGRMKESLTVHREACRAFKRPIQEWFSAYTVAIIEETDIQER